MSAFVVEDKTINRIVNWLSRVVDDMPLTQRELKWLGIDTETTGWEEKLAQEMFRLNVDAVNARYGMGEAAWFRPLNFAYKIEEPVSLIQTLKSLQCWLYQCTEGEVSDRDLYTLFDLRIQQHLMHVIISSTEEYEKADWG